MAAARVYFHKHETLVDKQAFRRFCLEFVIENDEFKPKSALFVVKLEFNHKQG